MRLQQPLQPTLKTARWSSFTTAGEADKPRTNIRLDQFEAHIAELSRDEYSVMALLDILAAMRNREDLPDRTAITIDGTAASTTKMPGLAFRTPGYRSRSSCHRMLSIKAARKA